MARNASSSPLDRLADLWFYAPIGALYRLRGGPFAWADEGRRRVDQQVQVARTIGRFAADRGRRELTRRLDAMAEQRRLQAEGSIIDTTAQDAEPASAAVVVVDLVATDQGSMAAPDGSSGPISGDDSLDAADLPIADYDSLAASQVVARLGALDPDDLASIAAYEAAHRGRRTVLGKVQQLQAR